LRGVHAESQLLGQAVQVQDNKLRTWLQQRMPLERYGWFRFLAFPKCCNEFFEGKSDDLVVQVQSVSMVRTDRLEGDSSGVNLKKSCSSLGRLGWENV
jgi:hypothetical protein